MSSPLVARTAVLCRSAFAKPALLNTVRFSSTQNKDVKDVIHLENEPVLSVENLSGAPGMIFNLHLEFASSSEKAKKKYRLQIN